MLRVLCGVASCLRYVALRHVALRCAALRCAACYVVGVVINLSCR